MDASQFRQLLHRVSFQLPHQEQKPVLGRELSKEPDQQIPLRNSQVGFGEVGRPKSLYGVMILFSKVAFI